MYAALYGIPVEDILDDYTLFLHRGGGAFLRRYRESKGWSRQQLADHAKVSRTSIRCWETGQKTISQKCFCLLVEKLGSDFPSMLRMWGMVIFLRSNEKARLQATICGSADGLLLWNRPVLIILIFTLTYTVLRSLFLFYLRCILSLPGGSQIFQQRPAHHRACSFGKRQPQCPAAGRLQRTGHHTGAAECLHHQLL